MKLQVKNFKPLQVLLKLSTQLFENLPTIVLFCSCAGFFYNYVYLLVARYCKFDTTVLIRYEAPKQIRFPAFTICGCSSKEVACTRSSWFEIREESAIRNVYTALDIMDNHSFTEPDLISQCYYFLDSRRPELKYPCTDIETVVESIHDGRKCFTYFTILHDTHSRGQVDSESEFSDNFDDTATPSEPTVKHSNVSTTNQVLETTDQYTAFIYVKINFSSIMGLQYKTAPSIQDASVIMSIHQTNVIPGMLDSEYIRIEPGTSYEIHFGKQVTYLKQKPYWTNCHPYDRDIKPRSKNECVNLCLMQQSFGHDGCLNYYNIVTRAWLNYLSNGWNASFVARQVRFCNKAGNNTGIDAYFSYIRARRYCNQLCPRDCTEESYTLVVDHSQLHEDGDSYGPNMEFSLNNASESVVVIWPDRKMYEIVQHNKEIDFFELIGSLGGHAHIWLGLSAIQLYDVAVMAIAKIKVLWQRFVYCA